jgi:hypothetical protein
MRRPHLRRSLHPDIATIVLLWITLTLLLSMVAVRPAH